ncbi:MAG: hypothetical protein VKN56_12905 [Cyanobacteriota bacterium]|nr:hypothetical protein [Cyanobacteriota bacterium]
MPLTSVRRLLNRLLHPLPASIAALFLCLLIFDAFPADSLMYHLPFSARFLHLPGFPDFTNVTEGRYQGFPSLWRILLGPGLAWNRPRLFIVPNLLALALLVNGCRRVLGVSAALAIVCCLTFPVALFGFRSSLQDFFVNAMVLVASIYLFRPFARAGGDPLKPTTWIRRGDLLGLLALGLAANVKFQGVFMAVLVLGATMFFRWREWSSGDVEPLRPRRGPAVLATLLAMLIFIQPLLNVSRFGNPFYPVRTLGLSGTEPRTSSPIQYIPRVPLLTNAASFLVSVTELDPIIRSEAGLSFTRSWHNHNLPRKKYLPASTDYPWILTGGSNGLLFLALLLGAFLSVFGCNGIPSLTLKPDLILRRRLLVVSLLFMILPQSMELRYYMSTLFLTALVAVSGDPTRLRHLMRWLVVAGLWYTLVFSFLQPLYFWSRTGEWISARGLHTPDVYRGLPSQQQCLAKRALWKGSISKQPDRTSEDVQDALACHVRLALP